MSEQAVLRSPQVVARQLDISPATLRRWSEEFKEYLSTEASAAGERSHRRYTDGDLATLLLVRKLMNDGLTYEQVRDQFNKNGAVSVEPDDIVSDSDILTPDGPELSALEDVPAETDDSNPADAAALVAAGNGAESAIAFLTNTLTTLSDSQKSILNSQAANRELLGVLLQDNFNLKEENNRLRERILEVEREVSQSRQEAAQSRQEEEWRREALRKEMDAKIAAVNQTASEAARAANAVEVPEFKTVETNAGCLGSLLGLKNQQIVPAPRRRKGDGGPPASPQQPSPPTSAHHPKPMYPPE